MHKKDCLDQGPMGMNMQKSLKHIVLSSLFVLGLSGCGEPAPIKWNANLDVNCKPQDIFDKASASVSAKKFWRMQEYDLGSLKKISQTNIKNVTVIFEDSRAQKGAFFTRADEAARNKGLSGKAKRAHVKENMDRYDQEVKALEIQLKDQKIALAWVQKCQRAVQTELRKLKLQPVAYNPAKRPR